MRQELTLAQRYLFRGKAKHISFIGMISCIGIAVGVFALIVVISVMNGFDKDLMERLLKFNYHLVIECLDKDLLTKLKPEIDKIKGVKSSSLIVQTQVFAKVDKYIVPLMVKGIDFADSKERNIFYQYVKTDHNNGGFFVGESLRERLGFDNIIEYYPLDKTFKLQQELIRGSFKVGIYDIDNNFIITNIDKAKALSQNYYLFLGLRIDSVFKASEIRAKILQEFPRGITVNTWMDYNSVLFSALKLEKITMFVILSLIILVASFNIFATTTVKVVEKTKDIGVLKAIGFRSKDIIAIFSLQGLFLGFIGVFTGAVLGLGLCIILQEYPLKILPEEIYAIEYLPVYINYRDIFLIAILGLILAFISSLFPAIRAAKLSPCEALRYE
jgi:lipoprotein-releasing system permease protein